MSQSLFSPSQLKHLQNTLSLIQKQEERKRAWIWNFVPLQAWVLHVSCDVPTHPLPPCLGSGLVQVLIRVPPPHVLEHPLKGEKPPCTGTNTNETISSWVNTITKRLSEQPPIVTITISIKSIRAPLTHTNTQRRYKEEPVTETHSHQYRKKIQRSKKQTQEESLMDRSLLGAPRSYIIITYFRRLSCCMFPAMRLHIPCRHF